MAYEVGRVYTSDKVKFVDYDEDGNEVTVKIKEEEIPKVSVISIVEDEGQFKSVLNNYSRQIYKNIELILIISHDELAKTAGEYFDEKGCINPFVF